MSLLLFRGGATARPPACDASADQSARRAISPGITARAATAAALLLLGSLWIVTRGCGYALGIPLAYAGYFALQVVLPGVVTMWVIARLPLSPARILALAVPAGFALEIATYLGLRALHAPGAMRLVPVFWAVLAIGACRRNVPFRWTPPRAHSGGVLLALCALGLLTTLAAAGHMYAEAPLVAGLPQRPIFHDWMYLLSRAAAIQQLWPLQDPSLAATPLQYHYFLLVHVASVSSGVGIEPTLILLRLAPVALGGVLLAQAYVLARRLGTSPWTGVIAAFLMIVPGELSMASDYSHLTHLGFFLRWLYVSPTFLFGLIFFGALAIAVAELDKTVAWRNVVWLGLLAGGATAAKGPVVPVVLVALAVYGAWAWFVERRVSVALLSAGFGVGIAFAAVYAATLSGCGDGDAQWQPFRLCEITGFWNDHAVPWQRALKRGLHAPLLGTWLGKSATAACILAGTAGIKVVALPYLARGRDRTRPRVARWLGALLVAATGLGLSLHFDAESEIYFLFLAQLPLAVLAAAGCVQGVSWIRRQWEACSTRGRRAWLRAAVGTCALAAGAVVIALQVATTLRCEAAGVRDWANMRADLRINDDLLPLYEATGWLRANTAPDAVLVSNAFTLETVGRDRGMLVDHITVGVNYQISALTGRRMWVEGPTYLLDTAEARGRLVAATRLFRDGVWPHSALLQRSAVYAVVDRTVGTPAHPERLGRRVFANPRFEIFAANAGTASD